MSTRLAPVDETIVLPDLVTDPYRIYARLRATLPVVRVPSIKRTLLTKAADTKRVKDDPVLFSSDDPSTPMERAFQAHTLMRKDGAAHLRERNAMAPAFAPRNIRDHWRGIYEQIAPKRQGTARFRSAQARGRSVPRAGRALCRALPGKPAGDRFRNG